VQGEGDVLAAARRCFAARPNVPPETILAGPLLDYVELFEGMSGFLQPLIWNANVRMLRVQSLMGDAAFCDCDVVTVGSYATAAGTRLRSVGRVTAPLVLERAHNEWRVVDYALNGRRVLRTIRLYDSGAAVHVGGGVTLQPRALELAT